MCAREVCIVKYTLFDLVDGSRIVSDDVEKKVGPRAHCNSLCTINKLPRVVSPKLNAPAL